MKRWLGKLFNIKPHEWPQLSLLALLFGLSTMGIAWGTTVAYTVFLKQVGVGALPWVTVISSVLSILALGVYTVFVDRISDDYLLAIIFSLGALGIVLGMVLIWVNLAVLAYPLMHLIFLAWAAVANPHFATYVNNMYDAQAVKRVFPVVAAAGRGGAIVGGLTMPLFNAWFSSPVIIFIWLLTYLMSIGLILLLPRLFPAVAAYRAQAVALAPARQTQKSGYLDSLREGFTFTWQSPFLRWMALGTVVMMVLMSLLEYRSSQLLAERFTTTAELSNFVGVLDGATTLFVLPMLLFGVGRLIDWIGLGNFSLLFPLGTMLISVGLARFPGLSTAAVAYFDRKALRSSLYFPVEGLLYNAVPLRVKGRARAFVSGLIVPVGSLLGGMLLLIPAIGANIWMISSLIMLLAAAYLGTSWFVRQEYSQALVKMLEQEDYSFLLSQDASDLSTADPETLKRLQQRLEKSESHEMRVFMTKMMTQVGGRQSVGVLEPAIRQMSEAHTRSAMLDVLSAAQLQDKRLENLCKDLLSDEAGSVRQAAIVGLERLGIANDEQIRVLLVGMLNDSHVDVRIQALQVLARSGQAWQSEQIVEALEQILCNEDPQLRAAGMRLLGEIGDGRALTRLLDYAGDQADMVRLEVALALEQLSANTLPRLRAANPGLMTSLIAQINPLLSDPVERARQAALVVMGRSGQSECYPPLVNALTDSSASIRTTAANALVQIGSAIVPMAQAQRLSPDPQMRKMIAVVLSRVNAREFSPLVMEGIDESLHTIYRNFVLAEALAPLARYRSVALVQAALREEAQQLAEGILYLLSALHKPESVYIIGESLRSPSQHTRANAIEALEAMSSPQRTRLIAPLFEPDVPFQTISTISLETFKITAPAAALALRQLAAHQQNAWLRAVTVFALGELGGEASSTPPPSAPPAAPASEPAAGAAGEGQSRRPARRRGGVDLFAALDGGSAEKAAPVDSEAPAPKPVIEETAPLQPVKSLGLPDLSAAEIQALISTALTDTSSEVRQAALAAQQKIMGLPPQQSLPSQEGAMLSIIDRIIFLKEVPFFQDMTVDQLKMLASVCEEKLFEQDARIFRPEEIGGVLYMVVSGKVGIEQEKRPGSFARLVDINAYAYFGEANFFDNSPRTTMAVALQDTLVLQLRREPLIALARQNPELSLKLINVLSQRLQEDSRRIAELTRSRPRELHKLFDQYE